MDASDEVDVETTANLVEFPLGIGSGDEFSNVLVVPRVNRFAYR